MRIDSSGNVGIGTASPDSTLSIENTTSSGATIKYDGQSNSEFGLRVQSNVSGGNFESDFANGGTALLDLFANSSATSGGDILVARTQASDPVLLVKGNGNVQIATTSTPSTSVFGYSLAATGLFKNSRDTGGSGASMQVFGNAGEARIMGDGDLLNTNNSYGQISDETLKQDIADAASQWADIKALKVRKFRFKDNPTGTLQIGVIAQELEASGMNGLVKQIDLNQNEDSEETIKAVKYSVLHMKAVKALQEAMERIEALETKVAALQEAIAKVETLETENTTQATQIADLITRVTALEAE